MSLLAKAVLAFAQRNPDTLELSRIDIDASTWSKWLELARADERGLEQRAAARTEARLNHGPQCLCTTCRLHRQAAAGLLPLQPSEQKTSGQREPEGPAEGGGAAGARSTAAADVSAWGGGSR